MMDPAVADAVRGKLGRIPEADDAGLSGFDALTVSRARGLDGIGLCSGVRILVLSGCDLRSIADVQHLTELRLLDVTDSALDDIEGLVALGDLHTVGIKRSSLRDISPLLRCGPLVEVNVAGCPLSDESYREVIPELISRGCMVTAPGERERQLMNRLWEYGLPFSYYSSAQGHRLSRPGLALTETPQMNHPVIAPDDLEELLASDPTAVEALFIGRDI